MKFLSIAAVSGKHDVLKTTILAAVGAVMSFAINGLQQQSAVE